VIMINLPFPIVVHAAVLVVYGIYLTFNRKPAALGITTLALGLSYLTTSYMPISENQFLHASVPVRVALGVVAAGRAATGPREEGATLWGIALYDGVGGLLLGWWLGRWNGRVVGY
jgi:hypothetical protein